MILLLQPLVRGLLPITTTTVNVYMKTLFTNGVITHTHTAPPHTHTHTHTPGDNPWDLCVHQPRRRDMVVRSEADRLRMDTGRANVWKGMPDGLVKKRSKLINESCGLTEQMLGVDSMFSDALEPYKKLVERLQTQILPIGHNIRRWITEFFKETNTMFLVDGATFGPALIKWFRKDAVSDALAEQVKNMGRQFVFHFLTDARLRLQPYWRLILAMETVNPCGPHRLSPDAWEGVRDLCKRVGMSDEREERVVRDLKRQRSGAEDWSLAEVKQCTNNLLRYYHERHATDKRDAKQPAHPLANNFAVLVFSLHAASAVIETYFSKTRYIKSIHRNRLSDGLSSDTMHLQQLRNYHDVEVLESSCDLSIDFTEALRRVEHDLDHFRNKYLGSRVRKPFYDEAVGDVRDYGGEVVSVEWSSREGCYLFGVDYDSDSDDEDMEHWELKKYLDVGEC